MFEKWKFVIAHCNWNTGCCFSKFTVDEIYSWLAAQHLFPTAQLKNFKNAPFKPLISDSQIKLLQLLLTGLILQQSVKNYNKLKLSTLWNRLKVIKTKSYSLLAPFRHHLGYSFLFEKHVKYFVDPSGKLPLVLPFSQFILHTLLWCPA